MFRRDINLIKSNSFFLFGPRGSGKSTLIRSQLSTSERFDVNLLDPLQLEEALVGLPTQKWRRTTTDRHEAYYLLINVPRTQLIAPTKRH